MKESLPSRPQPASDVKRYIPPALRNKSFALGSSSSGSDSVVAGRGSSPRPSPPNNTSPKINNNNITASKLRADTAIPFVPASANSASPATFNSKKSISGSNGEYSGGRDVAKEGISGQEVELEQALSRLAISSSPSRTRTPLGRDKVHAGDDVVVEDDGRDGSASNKRRPQTSALVANRMVAHALGIQIIRSPEREARDRLALQQAREEKQRKQKEKSYIGCKSI